MYKNLKISTRIMGMVFVFLLLLILAIAINLSQLQSLRTDIRHIAERDIPMVKVVTELTKSHLEQVIQFGRIIRFGKAMILQTNAKSKFIEAEANFNSLEVSFTKDLNTAQILTKSILQQNLSAEASNKFKNIQTKLKDIRDQHNNYSYQVQKVVKLLVQSQYSDAEQKTQIIELDVVILNQNIRSVLKEIVDFTKLSSQNAIKQEEFSQKITYALSFFSIILALFLGIAVTRSIISQLNLSVSIAESISQGQRDLSFPSSQKNEIGILGKTINSMMDTINQKEQQLISINTDLEYRVKSRTQQLEDKNKQLDLNNKELEKTNHIKNQFLGMAAHDLRSPLTIISGYADLFLVGAIGELSDKQKSYLEKIKTNGNSMLNLINDLLDISVIESGNLKLNITKQENPRDYFAEVHEFNSLLAESKSIELAFDCPNQLPPLFFDKDRLNQVLNNLISNAIKFSHKDTKITFGVYTSSKNLLIEITDQGQGIPENEIPLLFQEYSKTSVLPTGGEKSTGLGLAITKKIVESHGGDISVKSQKNVGSTFTITIPFDQDN